MEGSVMGAGDNNIETMSDAMRRKSRRMALAASIRVDISKLPRNEKERLNGFQCPLGCQQVGCWINCATTLTLTIALCGGRIGEAVFARHDGGAGDSIHAVVFCLLLLAFVLSAILTVKWAYRCTKAVPTDYLIRKQRDMKARNEKFFPYWEDTDE